MGDAAASVAVAVDVVVLTIRAAQLSVLVRPAGGHFDLLGGWLRPDERLDAAARRRLTTGGGFVGRSSDAHLEQLKTYDFDKRSTISVAYLSLLPSPPDNPTRHDRRAARWVPIACLSPGGDERLAADHVPILADGVERARAKLEYSSLATAFCAEAFTLADLRRVYEAVWGVRLDVPNFRRKVLSTPGLVEPLGCRASPASGGRPAELYRRGAATVLHPAMLRP
jgi:8-oxo-dGTP diphosphatase